MKIELERQELDDENIRSKIDRIEVIFLCVKPDQLSPLFPLYDIVREHSDIPDLNLFMIVGDDRADFLDTIADSFLFKNQNINSVNGQILAREDMDAFKRLSLEQLSEIDISEVPISAFSASFVRKLVKLGMKDKFDDVYKPYLSQDKIDHLYEIISKGLKKPNLEAKGSIVNPPKYTYPIFRGDDQFNELMIIISKKAAEKEAKTAEKEAKKAEKEAKKEAKTKKGGRKKRKSYKKYTRKNKYKVSQKYIKNKKY
jgi:hypothetical protein